jgi:hypothetical protein
MKLDKLAQGIALARWQFNLDATDILVLDYAASAIKERKSVTIMEIVDQSGIASPATIHARIKQLCDQRYFDKIAHPTNMRYKMLEFGPAYTRFIEGLKGV